MITLSLSLLLLAAFPTAAEPACGLCVCARPGPEDGSPERMRYDLDRSDVVFTGEPLASRTDRVGTHYLFAVRRSWKGPQTDTITVTTRGIGCVPIYRTHHGYLVHASRTDAGYEVGFCQREQQIEEHREHIEFLGPAAWEAEPDTVRSIEAAIARETAFRAGTMMLAGYVYETGDPGRDDRALQGVRIEVAGTEMRAVTDGRGRYQIRGLASGWHRLRLTLPDGREHDRYVQVLCFRPADDCGVAGQSFHFRAREDSQTR